MDALVAMQSPVEDTFSLAGRVAVVAHPAMTMGTGSGQSWTGRNSDGHINVRISEMLPSRFGIDTDEMIPRMHWERRRQMSETKSYLVRLPRSLKKAVEAQAKKEWNEHKPVRGHGGGGKDLACQRGSTVPSPAAKSRADFKALTSSWDAGAASAACRRWNCNPALRRNIKKRKARVFLTPVLFALSQAYFLLRGKK